MGGTSREIVSVLEKSPYRTLRIDFPECPASFRVCGFAGLRRSEAITLIMNWKEPSK